MMSHTVTPATAGEALDRIIESLGLVRMRDGRLSASDGRILCVRWDKIELDATCAALKKFHRSPAMNAELEVTLLVTEHILKDLYTPNDARAVGRGVDEDES